MIKAAFIWFLTFVVTQVDAVDQLTKVSGIAKAIKETPLTSSNTHPPLYGAKFFKLANGLEVYVLENNRTPVVGVFIGYRVGGADDPVGKSGLAHYLEHLMFKGPKDSSSNTIMPFTESVGGQANAMTTDDCTIYYELVPKQYMDKILSMESDRMHNLEILDEQAIPELKVILEERNMRIGNSPAGAFFMEIESAFFAHHPYRNPVIGWEHEIKSYTPQDVKDLHRRAYGPNNAIIVLSGDVTLTEAKNLVEKHFGKIPPLKLAPRKRVQEPPLEVHKKISLPSPLVDTPTLSIRYQAPNFKSAPLEQVFAIEVLADVLAGSENSIFYKHFVENKKLATNINVFYRVEAVDPHSITFNFSVAVGQSVEALEKEYKSFMSKLVKDGISEKVVERSKKRLLARFQLMRDSLLGGADNLIGNLLNGVSLDEMENVPNYFQRVQSSEVNKALKDVLGREFNLIAALIPSNKKPSSGGANAPIIQPGPLK